MITLKELGEQREGLIAYLKVKIAAADWHAVQDAASDIREVEAKIEVVTQVIGETVKERYSIDDDRVHPIRGAQVGQR